MSKFSAGDIVRIREWDEMAAEYGITDEDIDLGENKPWFTRPMRDLCGVICIVTAIETVSRYELVRIKELEDNPVDSPQNWNFCDEMLELVDTYTTEIPESDFDSLLEV